MINTIQRHLVHIKTYYDKTREDRMKRINVLQRVMRKETDFFRERLRSDYKILLPHYKNEGDK